MSFLEEYAKKAHAIQTGVEILQASGSNDGSPKHLRVGVNLALRDLGTLSYLLIEKGIITEEELQAKLLAGLDAEIASYEADCSKALGSPVHLI